VYPAKRKKKGILAPAAEPFFELVQKIDRKGSEVTHQHPHSPFLFLNTKRIRALIKAVEK
jgi:hypothetical protein